MNIILNKRASNVIRKVAKWIDKKNTEGAGDRWFDNLEKELNYLATIKVKHAICKDPTLSKYEYRCFSHKDKWIVAYKIVGDEFVIYRFIYGPWLDY
jgi:hypothetical protein